MAITRVHTIVAVVGIGLAGTVAWWWQNRPAGAPAAALAGAASAPRIGAPGGPGAGGPPGRGGPSGPVPVEVGRVQAVRLTYDVQAVGPLR